MFKIKNWSSFQSYKDRQPPWIRLHKNLLDDFAFQKMGAEARAMLPMLWLMASEDKDPVSGLIRFGYEAVAFRLRMQEKVVKAAIAEIIRAGFITEEKTTSYETVTGSLRNCHSETETETETYSKETEKETESGVAKTRPKKATQLPSDFELPEEWGEWAEGLGMTFDQIVLESEKFKDYWHGTGKPKADWQATWRNWIRSHLERKK